MHSRFPAHLLVILLVLLSLSSGCTSPGPSQGTVTPSHEITPLEKTRPPETETVSHAITAPKESIADQLASVQSSSPVWLETCRMFRNTKSTEYVHPPYTDDDAAGVYRFDCLGFVDHEGNPVGLYWEGGASPSAREKDTTIVCGRLTR